MKTNSHIILPVFCLLLTSVLSSQCSDGPRAKGLRPKWESADKSHALHSFGLRGLVIALAFFHALRFAARLIRNYQYAASRWAGAGPLPRHQFPS